MKEEQVKQVVESTEQAVLDITQYRLAEDVNKLRKKQFNFNNTSLAVLIAGIVFIIVMGLFSYFIVAATNNNSNEIQDTQDANTLTIVSAINAGDQNIVNGQADIIAGLDGVNTKVDEFGQQLDDVVASNNKVIEETQKVAKKVDSLSSLLAKANKTTLHRYQSCLYNHVTVEKKLLVDAVAICTKHLQ